MKQEVVINHNLVEQVYLFHNNKFVGILNNLQYYDVRIQIITNKLAGYTFKWWDPELKRFEQSEIRLDGSVDQSGNFFSLQEHLLAQLFKAQKLNKQE